MIRNIIRICVLLLIFYKPLVYAAEYDEYDSVSNINTEKKQYSRTVSGTVKDSEGNPMPGVTVQMEGSDYGTITEGNGFYKMGIPDGKVVLVYSFMGFTSHKEEFSDDDRKDFIRNITLKESAYNLEEVTVTGKGREQIKREAPAAITIIDASELKGRTASLEKILNHASGVQVMSSGGFGSTSRVLVQGMDGKRISIFVNGMPMGSSEEFSLSSIPTDYIQNVEIYKGTIPAWLGGDGLGGAINIITKEFNSNHLEVSYQISSYNTHQGNFITSTAFPKSGIAVKLNGTFDYSDNDYDFNSPFEPGRVIHRDHDVYRNLNINAGISFSRLWFDNLDLSFAYGNNYDQVQGGLMNIQNNIQHAFSRSNSFQAMQSLAKKTRNGKWSFSLNSMIDYTIGNVVDTSYYCYDFAGNKFPSGSGRGEVGALPNDSRDIYLSVRELLNINYRINHNHILNWNTSYKYSSKTPHDELADEYASYPVSGYPNRLHSLVSGLNYELKLFDGKLKNEAGIKLFYHNSEVIPSADGNIMQQKLTIVKNDDVSYGWNESLAWVPIKDLTVKGSVQRLVRIPTAEETFGDGVMLYPSVDLKPEKSLNFNIGLEWLINSGGYPYCRIGINAFYMRVEDMIKLMYSSMNMAYDNIGKVVNKGIEGEVKADFFSWMTTRVNVTWQDARDKRKDAVGGGPNFHYDYRIPNMPYFFGNAMIDFHKEDLFTGGLDAELFVEGEFTEKFSYNWEASNRNTLIIPRRWGLNAGIQVNYKKHYGISFEVHNITDEEHWAEYRYPLPGRTFHLKLKYIL